MATTAERVPAHTAEIANRRIRRQTDRNILYYTDHPEEVEQRLQELDREWDVERTLQANAASVSIAAVVLGLTASRKWFILPGIVGGFLLQHALQGWCPPLPAFRRLGVRTQREIERERHALLALRDQMPAARRDERRRSSGNGPSGNGREAGAKETGEGRRGTRS